MFFPNVLSLIDLNKKKHKIILTVIYKIKYLNSIKNREHGLFARNIIFYRVAFERTKRHYLE